MAERSRYVEQKTENQRIYRFLSGLFDIKYEDIMLGYQSIECRTPLVSNSIHLDFYLKNKGLVNNTYSYVKNLPEKIPPNYRLPFVFISDTMTPDDTPLPTSYGNLPATLVGPDDSLYMLSRGYIFNKYGKAYRIDYMWGTSKIDSDEVEDMRKDFTSIDFLPEINEDFKPLEAGDFEKVNQMMHVLGNHKLIHI